jgi:hypothetical protein
MELAALADLMELAALAASRAAFPQVAGEVAPVGSGQSDRGFVVDP